MSGQSGGRVFNSISIRDIHERKDYWRHAGDIG